MRVRWQVLLLHMIQCCGAVIWKCDMNRIERGGEIDKFSGPGSVRE